MTRPVSPPPLLPPSWIARHWPWFVPVLVLATIGVLIGFFSLVFGVMKSSDAYQLAVARAKASPAVIAALGAPVTEGYLVYGNIHVSTTAGQAQLEIPLNGSKADATVYVVAHKSAGAWRFETLMVGVEKSSIQIDLSDPAPPKAGSKLPAGGGSK